MIVLIRAIWIATITYYWKAAAEYVCIEQQTE